MERGTGAVDRRQLAKEQPPKIGRWPRTDRRAARIERVLARRQPDLAVVLENVHDAHNVGAVLRSCDAVGVPAIHLVYTDEVVPDAAFARSTTAGAAKWVEVVRHASAAECFAQLRAEGKTILVAALTAESAGFYDQDLRRPTALVFGNETRGVTEGTMARADGAVVLPMMGMVESLNISVAVAVALFEALRQRLAGGDYAEPKWSEEERAAMMGEWLRR